MKKVICVLSIISMVFLVGCSDNFIYKETDSSTIIGYDNRNDSRFKRFPHEYIGVVKCDKDKEDYWVVCEDGMVLDIYKTNVYKYNVAYESFLMQNVGKLVKVKLEVVATHDHTPTYGSYEIIEYEVIN